jgi:cytochrome c5
MHARALMLAAVVLVGCGKATPQGQVAAASDTSAGRGGAPALTVAQQRLLEAAEIALPPGMAVESLPEPNSPGAKILAQYCTQCHALPSPAMHGPVDWPSVVRRMWVRIDMLAGSLGVQIPETAQRSQLLTYLQAHALQVAANLPAGPGKEAFETTCSRCHALADPKVHSPPDWPVVVMRMEKNMEKMKVSGVTHDRAVEIIGYLQKASARPHAR